MNLRGTIKADEIHRLYVDEHRTTAQLAKHYHCSEATIIRRLEELGTARRTPRPYVDRERKFAWSHELAYAVGLIATDGNLSPDGRHMTVVSKDYDLLETLRACLGLNNAITNHSKLTIAYRIQWGDRQFYDWLQSI